MPKIIIALLFSVFVPLLLEATEPILPPIVDGKFTYQQTIPVQSTSMPMLYARAKLFLAENFRSSPDVIKLDDKENGIIVTKGLFVAPFMLINVDIWFTLKIEIKENRYRVTVTDFEQGIVDSLSTVSMDTPGRYLNSKGKPRMGWGKTLEAININTTKIMDSLKVAMTKGNSRDDF